MKTKHLLLALVIVSPFGLLLADDVPKAFTLARYQAMMDRSPFAVATAAVAAPAATPNFAKDLYIANAAHSKDGDFVTIASSADKNFKKYVSTNLPDDGYSISSVEWSDKVGATKVTITKDGQVATLTFNEALLKQSAGSNPAMQMPQPQLQQPQQNIQAQSIVPSAQALQLQKPAPIPQLPTPPPRVRGVIPKNPALQGPVATPTPEVEL